MPVSQATVAKILERLEAGVPITITEADVDLIKVGGTAITLGQKTAAASVPVVLPSDGTLPLPTGAATGAKQDTGNTSLAALLTGQGDGSGATRITDGVGGAVAAVISSDPTTQSGLVVRNIPSGTQPISAASLPLPAGAATSALQQTDALTDAELRASAVPVSATSLPLPSGAATEATLAAQSTFDHGAKSAIGTTALQITASSIAAKKGVTVKASVTNTGIVYVGNSDVTAGTTDATDGIELSPGDWITVPVDNANKVYVRCAAAISARVSWLVA